ncbi:uncharacterized protein LOC135203352 [Macrobrachium nipponense]|uniref:uncharacterized protein LOC135203352 n=1 Tax=Macrobrachium nipponense TaxID=159736 RepID=UPI0030C7AB17
MRQLVGLSLTSVLLLVLCPLGNTEDFQISNEDGLSFSNDSVIISSSTSTSKELISFTPPSPDEGDGAVIGEMSKQIEVEVEDDAMDIGKGNQSTEEAIINTEKEESNVRGPLSSDVITTQQPADALDGKRALSGYVGFPYRYEQVPSELRRRVGERRKTHHRVPVPLSVQDVMDRNDEGHSITPFEVQRPIQDIVQGFGSHGQDHHHVLEQPHQHQHQHQHHQHHQQGQHHRHPMEEGYNGPPTQMSQTEIDFLGILAAIALKLLISTALASWFLFAGQSLYSIASVTGTTAVFGQDSSLGYIYKTLPLVEAILRGEQNFYRRND